MPTEQGRLDPRLELETWLERLQELLDQWASLEAAAMVPEQDAFDLITLLERLKRIRPKLLETVDVESVRKAAQLRLTDGTQSILERALEVPNSAQWLAQAEALEASYYDDPPAEPGLQSEAACRLFEDLDDVDLLLHFAQGQRVAATELERGLAECHAWLANSPSTLLAASAFIQTRAQLLRPDLSEHDPGLAKTAEKYRYLLDELLEDTGSGHNVVATVFVECNAMYRADGPDSIPLPSCDWLPVNRTQQIAASAAPGQPVRSLSWNSPDGALEALLAIDPASLGGDTERVPLVFCAIGAQSDIPSSLTGQAVWLAGEAGQIDETATAWFVLKQLREASTNAPALEVQIGRLGPRLRSRGVRIDPPAISQLSSNVQFLASNLAGDAPSGNIRAESLLSGGPTRGSRLLVPAG